MSANLKLPQPIIILVGSIGNNSIKTIFELCLSDFSDCGQPDNIYMGSVKTFEGVARYSCDKGHTLVGSNIRLCQSNRWEGTIPHCEGQLF